MSDIKKVQTKIEYPATNKLDRLCKWGRPAFEPYDGIGEQELWTLEGLVVALGFISDDKQYVIGSGVMVAPGICLTATHVIDETKEKQALLYTFPRESSMRMWKPEDFHALEVPSEQILFEKPEQKFSDVSLLSYSPFSRFEDDVPHLYAPLEVALPKIGERLWAAGYREVSNDGTPQIGFFITSGLVVEQYPEGRGGHFVGACIEVAMKALGGMSGGPVFNEDGRIVGVISSCMEGQADNKGPTYVTLIWPSLMSTIYTPWPEDHWPDSIGGLQVDVECNGVRVKGEAKREDGTIRIKFPQQDSNEIHQLFKKSGDLQANQFEELDDYIYELLEPVLEHEGLEYLSNLCKHDLSKCLVNSEYSKQIELFDVSDAETFEGIDDISIKSATLLESGNIGLDIVFDLSGVILALKMAKDEYLYHRKASDFKRSFHNLVDEGDYITLQHYVKPIYRVSLTYDPKSVDYLNFRVLMLTLKT